MEDIKSGQDAARAQRIGRLLLGGMLALAGISHLTFKRKEFQAQVPPWVPMDVDTVVVLSGVAEVALGSALVAAPKHKEKIGWTVASFFVGVFPGNIAQYTERRNAFGLNSDRARFFRLFFQPVLVAWALWSTDAWQKQRKQIKQ